MINAYDVIAKHSQLKSIKGKMYVEYMCFKLMSQTDVLYSIQVNTNSRQRVMGWSVVAGFSHRWHIGCHHWDDYSGISSDPAWYAIPSFYVPVENSAVFKHGEKGVCVCAINDPIKKGRETESTPVLFWVKS